MRVLHILNSAGGGAAMSTIDLARALGPKGITSAAVCHAAGTRSEREELLKAFEGRVDFRQLCWWNKKIRARLWKRPVLAFLQLVETGAGVWSTRAVTRAARAHRADLIHTNTILTPEGARAAAHLALPHVWHVRELVGRGHPFPIAGMKGRVRRLLGGSAAIVANSSATAKALREATGLEQIEVIANGVDLAPLLELAPRSEGGPLVIAMVGSLAARWKKHELFLETAAALRGCDGVEFRVYGRADFDGDGYAGRLRRRCEALGAGGCVRWMGHVDGAANVMRDVDILVHPADQESFGRVLVEAMGAARPVVAPRGGGAADVVLHEETGLLVSPDCPEDLAAATLRLISDRELRLRLGLAGRARAVSCFSLESLVARMLDCYRKVLEGNAATERRLRHSTP